MIRTKVMFLHLEDFLFLGSFFRSTDLFPGTATIFFMNQTHNEQQNDQQSIQYQPHIHKRPHPRRQTNVCEQLLRGLNIHRLYE